jgi:hypothetical protein
MGTKLIYVDDSGANATGFVTYSFCMVDIVDWREALGSWLAWREQLSVRDGIPKAYELHAPISPTGGGTLR